MKTLLAEVNISEGKDKSKIKKIKKPIIENENIDLIDEDADENHNRSVFTYVGEPEEILKVTKKLADKAIELIDMRKHKGSHPRMGAIDVVPFVPVRDITDEEAIKIAEKFGKYLGEKGIPVYYYEKAAKKKARESLVNIRKGQYEALEEKMKDKKWIPDEGPHKFIPKSGATVTGVRFPLIAFNVNLKTSNLKIAKEIVKAVRGAKGGYKYVRAIALELKDKNMVQVSMNLVNYEKTPIHRVMETIRSEASSYGVDIAEAELVGPVPLDALEDILKHYLQVHNFSMEQIY